MKYRIKFTTQLTGGIKILNLSLMNQHSIFLFQLS